jgi:hypothetical protein
MRWRGYLHFKEHAELPTDLVGEGRPKKAAAGKSLGRKPQKHAKQATDHAADRKAALAFEKEQKRRERERAKEWKKERERRQHAVDKAQSALDAARRKHEKNAADIQTQIEVLEEMSQAEDAHWEKERERAALRRTRG